MFTSSSNESGDLCDGVRRCVLRFPDVFAFMYLFFFFLVEKFDFSINFQSHVDPVYCLGTYKFYFSATFSLKISPTVLFTHLKIILLQYFSVFNCIQTDPISIVLQYEMQEIVQDLDFILSLNEKFGMNHTEC